MKFKNSFTTTVFCPDKTACIQKGQATNYPRVIELRANGTNNGRLLATFENDLQIDLPNFPIFESIDGGKTWHQIGAVADVKNGWGNRFHPDLIELQTDMCGFKKGTLLCAGLSVPAKLNGAPENLDIKYTEIVLYASVDCGKSWEYVSSVDIGGSCVEDTLREDDCPIWEPNLVCAGDKLVCFFSDERRHRDGYAQNIVYRYTTDGVLWSPLVDVVRKKTLLWWKDPKWDGLLSTTLLAKYGFFRYGMPIVKKLSNNKFLMVYELVGLEDLGTVYYKISDDGLNWGDPDDPGIKLILRHGNGEDHTLHSMPYITVRNTGEILICARRDDDILTGERYGHIAYSNDNGKTWSCIDEPIHYDLDSCFSGWSMGMTFFGPGQKKFIQLTPAPCKEHNVAPTDGSFYCQSPFYDIRATICDVEE